MSSRPRRSRSHYVYDNEPAAPPPANWMTTVGSQLPMPFVLVALVGFAVWYGTSNTERTQSNKELDTLKTGFTELTKAFTTATKEQDERRAALGKEFLASNEKIVTKVGELATTLAVQQAQTKATSDALVDISKQLQQLGNTNGIGKRK